MEPVPRGAFVSTKITWWPARDIKGMVPKPLMVLMRYDWPDQRLYEVGMYTPKALLPWTNSEGQSMGTPDYFTALNQDIVEFIKIPGDREYTYVPKPLPETARRRYCLTCKHEPEWISFYGECKLSVSNGDIGAVVLKRYSNPDEVVTGNGERVMNCTGWEEKS